MGLDVFQRYTGHYGLSTGGWGGDLDLAGTIRINVPAGATIVAAYLYASYFGSPTGGGGLSAAGSAALVTINGETQTWTSLGAIPNGNHLEALRADVTALVAEVIDGATDEAYDFDIVEPYDAALNAGLRTYFTNRLDGEGLVVIYELASLPISTIVLFDGWAKQEGDSITFNYVDGIDPDDPDYFAEVRCGIGFSSNDESTELRCNGHTFTTRAGNHDDGVLTGPGSPYGGGLITVGGDGDPLQYETGLTPTYANTHERFTLLPALVAGDTSITVATHNTTGDDLVFLMVFWLAGTAYVNEPAVAGFDFPPFEMAGTGSADGGFVFPLFEMDGEGFSSVERLRWRQRVFPHVNKENYMLFCRRLELEFQRGVATASGDGALPLIRLRISRDGGLTYGTPLWATAGTLGDNTARAYWNRMGRARDFVFEVMVSSPVLWGFLAAYGDFAEGPS